MYNEFKIETIKKSHIAPSINAGQAAQIRIEQNAENWRSTHKDNISYGNGYPAKL